MQDETLDESDTAIESRLTETKKSNDNRHVATTMKKGAPIQLLFSPLQSPAEGINA